jgi:hypothetical protein
MAGLQIVVHRFAVLCVLSCAAVASAQTPARLRGRIADSSGSPVSGVTVHLLKEGQDVATALSSISGSFTLSPVPPGHYDVATPVFNGLAAQDVPVDLSPTTKPLVIILAPATVVENMQVNGGQSLSTAAADNKDSVAVSGESLNHLPVFDQDPIATLTEFLDPSTIDSGGVSIIVDGVELKGPTVTPSAIAELRINRDPFSAEFSNPGRGRIEITTKPGSPEYHGTFNVIFRDAIFNGRNFFSPVRPPEQRRIYEGHVTGPVGHGGHTNFLVSGTRREEDLQSAVHAVGPPGLLGFDANGNLSENVSTPSLRTQLNGRITHDFSSAHQVSVAYNFEYETRQNQNVGGTILPEAGIDTDSREDDLIVNDRILVSPNLVQQLALVVEKDEDVTRSVSNAPSIQVQGSFTAGGAQQQVARTENTLHVSDIVSWTHKHNYVRFGISNPLQLSRRAVDDRSNRLGTFNFNSVADFENRTPYQFTVQQGIGRGLFWFNPLDAFAQDEISLRHNLQVTVGLRYQWQTYLSDLHSFAPRVSFAYSPSPRWVVRGGSGIFYDRTGGDLLGTFKLHNGIVLRQFQVLNPGYPNAIAPSQNLAAVPTSLVRESASLQAPVQILYSATVERELGKRLTATATYRGITGIHIFRSSDANAPLPPDFTTRPDPNLGFVQQIESEGRSRLNALDLGLHGSIGTWFQGQAQYTFSHANSDTDGLTFYPQNQYQPSAEWGRSLHDHHHRFNLLGTIHPDHWLSLGVAARLYSGAPYNELAGADFYNTGLGNARPAGVGRNSLQGTGTADLDLSWNHDFHLVHKNPEDTKVLNLGVSAFNVLNHTNLTNFVGNLRSPLFRQATAALAARQIQFQARYQF